VISARSEIKTGVAERSTTLASTVLVPTSNAAIRMREIMA
jgi:hypothetical protein